MPTTVDIPEIGTVEFPDSMSLDEITETIKSKIVPQKTAPVSETEAVPQDTNPPIERQSLNQPLTVGTRAEVLAQYHPNAETPEGAAALTRLAAIDALPELPVESVAESVITAAQQPTMDLASKVRKYDPGTRIATEIGKLVEPMLPKPVSQAVEGVKESTDNLINFFTSPVGLATLGTGSLPVAAQRAVAGTFATQMATHAPEIYGALYDELQKPEGKKDFKKIASLTTDAITTTGFAGLAGTHALMNKGPKVSIAKDEIPLVQVPGEKPGEVRSLESGVSKIDLGNGVSATIQSSGEIWYEKDGARLGKLESSETQQGDILVEHHHLDEEIRGYGYGGKAILELSKLTGKRIISDNNPSASAGKMWDRIGAKRQKVTLGEGDWAETSTRYVLEPKKPHDAEVRSPIVQNLEQSSAPLTAKTVENLEVKNEAKTEATEIQTAPKAEDVSPVTETVREASIEEAVATETPPEPTVAKSATVQEPELIGMGGAIPSEFEVSPSTATGIKNAQVDIERQQRGLPPAMQPAKRTFGAVWDEAMAKIDRDPEYTDRLLDELRDKPRALTDLEDATLLQRQIALQNEYGKATRDLAQAFDDGRMEAVEAEKSRVAQLSDMLLDVYEIGKKVGTETGRGLAARKMMAFEDFSLAKMELEKRASKGGAQLTDAERAEVVRLNKEIGDSQKRYDEYVSAAEEKISRLEAEKVLAEAAKSPPVVEPHVQLIADKVKAYFDARADAALKRLSGKLFTISPQVLADLTDLGVSKILSGSIEFGQWSAKMVEALGDKIKPHLQTVWESSQGALDNHIEKISGASAPKVKRAARGTDVAEQVSNTKESISEKFKSGKLDDIKPLVAKLSRLFLEQGIKERDALIDAVHAVLKETKPEITRRETMDAISGYGDFRQLTKDEISVQLRDLKGQMQQVAKLEDIESRKPPMKSGIERRAPSDEERRLIKLVNEAKRKYGIVVTNPEVQLKSALQARKTYYTNRISDLRNEITKRERDVKSKTPPPTDAELDALKKEYASVKAEHDSIFERPELTDEQRLKMAIEAAKRSEEAWADRLEKAKKGDFSKEPRKQSPSNAELESIRARREALKEEVEKLQDLDEGIQKAKELKRLESKKETLQESIVERERKLREGDLSTSGNKINRPLSPELEPLRQQLDALNKKLSEARKKSSAKPEEQKEAERIATQVDALNKRIAEREAQIASGKVEPQSKSKLNRPLPPELEQARQKLDALNEQIAELRHPSKTDLDKLKSRMAAQTRKLEQRLATKDFSKRKPKSIAMDAEANKLHYEMTQAKIKWHEALMKDRLANRTPFEKARDTVAEVLNTARAIKTSLDLSAVLRQGGFIAIGHPIRAAKAFPDMFRALKSEEGQHAVNREIAARKNFPLYQQAKLYLSEHGHSLAKMEEAYMSRWADKIPGVVHSQRAYVTFLNRLRADSFDAMAESFKSGKELTPEEANAIANFVNVSTGRGNLGAKENALVGMNTVFFAPRYVASRFQLLGGAAKVIGDTATGFKFHPETARARKLIAKEYARFLAGMAVVYTLASSDPDAQVELDPRSSDFGKIRYGKTRVDPMAGLLQSTVLLSRLASGETKKGSGKIVPIRGDKIPYGGQTAADVMAQFLRTKLSPAIGMGVDVATGKNVVGQPVTPGSTAVNLLTPLALSDILKTMEEQGVPRGTALSILSIFGMGLQTYDERKK